MIVSAVRDPYPTRDKSEGALIRRAEPVLYSEWTEDSPLTKEQMAQFERDGYLVLTDVFSAHELNELRAAAERASKNCAQTHAGQLIKEADGEQCRVEQAMSRGARVQAVVEDLGGEKIDIIAHTDDQLAQALDALDETLSAIAGN